MDTQKAYQAFEKRRTALTADATNIKLNPAIRKASQNAANALNLAGCTYADMQAAVYKRAKLVSSLGSGSTSSSALPEPITNGADDIRLLGEQASTLTGMTLRTTQLQLEAETLIYGVRALAIDALVDIQLRITDSWRTLSEALDETTLRDVITNLIKTIVVDVIDVSNVLALIEAVLEAINRRRKQLESANELLNSLDSYEVHAMEWSVLVQELIDVLEGATPDPTFERAVTHALDRLRRIHSGEWQMPEMS